MTEKRYTVGDELRVVDDNILKGTFYVCIDRAEALKVADKLNEFHNENIRLNSENEQLKQFKEDVFNKIDMHLRMLPTARDNEFNEDDGDPSLYTGAIYMLETLKKELEE